MILYKILSFLPCFEAFLMISGYQIVVFCCFSWYFRGVEDSGENCVRSVLVAFSLCNSLFCPLRHFRLRFLV